MTTCPACYKSWKSATCIRNGSLSAKQPSLHHPPTCNFFQTIILIYNGCFCTDVFIKSPRIKLESNIYFAFQRKKYNFNMMVCTNYKLWTVPSASKICVSHLLSKHMQATKSRINWGEKNHEHSQMHVLFFFLQHFLPYLPNHWILYFKCTIKPTEKVGIQRI